MVEEEYISEFGSTEYYECDSESSCSEVSWSSWPEEVNENDYNACLGEIYFKMRKAKRQFRKITGRLPRNRFGRPRRFKKRHFRGGKGQLKAKGFGKRTLQMSFPEAKNPRGKDGRPLTFHNRGLGPH